MGEPRTPRISDIRHMRICGDKNTYCGHPRQGGLFDFGDGHLALVHNHAPCAYQKREDVQHDFHGYHARSVQLLQRSFDGGETWPESENVVVFRESDDIERRREFLGRCAPGVPRDEMSLRASGSCIYFGRTWAGEPDERGTPGLVCFSIRSADCGRTWEDIPTVIHPPVGFYDLRKDNHPLVTMPDGTYLGAMVATHGREGVPDDFGGRFMTGAVHLYGSDDEGISWAHLAEIARDPTGRGRCSYPGLLLLPCGRLQCYVLNIYGRCNALMLSESENGYEWTQPRSIVRWGASPWAPRRQPGAYGGSFLYRSPWTMVLADGRILVLFGRRRVPYGIGAIVSDDAGATWSNELILRDDGNCDDLGYNVATQLPDGRIFTAYYFTGGDKNSFGGSRHIAGTFFRLG